MKSDDALIQPSKSIKYLEAKKTLPPELHAMYDDLVSDYYYFTVKNYGRGYVAYKVLADLVRGGWVLKADVNKSK